MKSILIKALMLLCLINTVGQKVYGQTHTVEILKKPVVINSFSLSDQDGNPFNKMDLQGGWSLVFLGFTSCPDICPRTMSMLEGVRAQLGLKFRPQDLPKIIFVAVDPERDREVLGGYLDYFHPENIGLTGSHDQLDILVDGVEGYYKLEKTGDEKVYDVVHTATIAILNPEADMVAKINLPFDINIAARELMLLIRNKKL